MTDIPSPQCYLYVLRSQVKEWYYIGVTNHLEDRLARHNAGRSLSTKAYAPFELIFTKSYATKGEAMREEARLKGLKSRERLLSYIQEGL